MVALARAMAEVNSKVEMDEVLALGVDRAAAILDAAVAFITFQTREGWVVASGYPGESSRRATLPEDSPEAQVRATGAPLISDVRDRSWGEGTRGWAEQHGMGSHLAVPMRSAGELVGVLALVRRAGDQPFDDDDVLLAELVASPLAAAIQVAALFERARADRRRSEMLLQSTDLLWRPAPFLSVAAEVVRQATAIAPGTECMISIVPPERPSHFRMVAGSGAWAEAQVGKEWPWIGTVAGSAMSESRIIETTRLQQESSLATVLAEGGIETARLIPLTAGTPLPDGRIAMGVLGFYRPGGAAFGESERLLMDEFGKRVSLALHRAELLDSATRANERLRTGIELTLELASALDDHEVMRRLLERAAESARADRATLSLVEGDEMIVQDGYDRDGRPIPAGGRYRIPPGSPTERAIQTGRPKTGEAFDPSHLDAASLRALGDTRHTVVIPLVLGGKVGAILMLLRRSDQPFNREEVEGLQLVGNAAAVALRNAELYGEAHDLNRTKSDFMNLAAHELRTPLSVISGYVSMLQDGTFGPPPAPWVQPLSVLSAKSGELGVLVEDLLVAARLEAGTMPTAISDFDLRDAVNQSLARCAPRATLLGAEVSAELPPVPVPVRADPDHLARILDNLVNNALTYTLGRPRVAIEVVPGPPHEVVVSDHGVGIPEEARERIFERFVRLDHPELPRQPGTGLGLAISRELAERYGGRLELLPSPEGSRFRLSLPEVEAGG